MPTSSAETPSFASSQELVMMAEHLRASDVHPLNTEAITSELNHNGFLSVVPAPQEDGIHLKQEVIDHLAETGRLPHRASFSPLPLRSVGRDNSRHGVVFGDLELHNFTPRQNEEYALALKPSNGASKERSLTHEFAMNEYLGKLGLTTFQQLGFWRRENSLYTLSTYEPQVITLDTLDWEGFSESETMQALERGIGSLVVLHSYGVFHGDSELKNLAIEPNLQTQRIVDTEYAVSIASQDPDETIGQPNGLLSKLKQDLRQLCKSIDDYSIGSTEITGFENHYAYVLAPYRKLVMKSHGNGPYAALLRRYVDTVIELLYAESMGDTPLSLHVIKKIPTGKP